MTISTSDFDGGPYAGNGSTTVFSTGFAFNDDSWVKVILYDSAGVPTVKTITTHYTVSGSGTGNAGSVTMLTAPATGEILKIEPNVPSTQISDYINNEAFPNSQMESDLDKICLQIKGLQSDGARVLKITGASTLSGIEIPEPQAGYALVGNATEDGYENQLISALDGVTVLDEDTMVSNSATAVPTQQSTKAYVDNSIAAINTSLPEWEPLGVHTISGVVSSWDYEYNTSYDDFKFVFVNVQTSYATGTGLANLAWRVSTDGVSYDSGASDYDMSDNTPQTSGVASATSILGSGTNVTKKTFLWCEVFSPRAAKHTFIRTDGFGMDSTTVSGGASSKFGGRTSAQAETHIRFLADPATAASLIAGTIYVYGRKYPTTVI